jgi:hypothetical protein
MLQEYFELQQHRIIDWSINERYTFRGTWYMWGDWRIHSADQISPSRLTASPPRSLVPAFATPPDNLSLPKSLFGKARRIKVNPCIRRIPFRVSGLRDLCGSLRCQGKWSVRERRPYWIKRQVIGWRHLERWMILDYEWTLRSGHDSVQVYSQ